jgi:lipoprotein-anchoring transpeptidase ErfK/SrfK
MAAVIFTNQLSAQQPTVLSTGAAQTATAIPTVPVQREIIVSLEDRKLALIENGQVRKIYAVAVGKPSTPSPEGIFTIERRVANPVYHHDGKTVLPGPGNPVGTRWMGLSKSGYGIHGTNEPRSIGKAASHGCIRMARRELEEFYALVAVGDTVRLVGQRNEQTAQLFGNDVKPGTSTDENRAAQLANATTEPASTLAVPSPATSAAVQTSNATNVASMGTR